MNKIKSVRINGEELYFFDSEFYILQDADDKEKYSIHLELVIGEDDKEKYYYTKEMDTEIVSSDDKNYTIHFWNDSTSGDVPSLFLTSDYVNVKDYDGLTVLSWKHFEEKESIEDKFTLADIRKVKMPYREHELELLLPIDQIEWLLQHHDKEELSKVVEGAIYHFMNISVKCHECDGRGRKINPVWDEEFDRMDSNTPSFDFIHKALAKRGIEQYVECSICNGTGELK